MGYYGNSSSAISAINKIPTKYSLSPEFQQAIDLFSPSGGYGTGQMDLVNNSLNRGVATSAINAVGSGMSSGSMAAGMNMRAANDAATQKRLIDDERVKMLAAALQARASAGMQAKQMSGEAYARIAQLLSNLYGIQRSQDNVGAGFLASKVNSNNAAYLEALKNGLPTWGMPHS